MNQHGTPIGCGPNQAPGSSAWRPAPKVNAAMCARWELPPQRRLQKPPGSSGFLSGSAARQGVSWPWCESSHQTRGQRTTGWNGQGELVCPLRGQSLESRLAAQPGVRRAQAVGDSR